MGWVWGVGFDVGCVGSSIPPRMVSMIGPVDHQSAQPQATVSANYHPFWIIIDTGPTASNHVNPAVGNGGIQLQYQQTLEALSSTPCVEIRLQMCSLVVVCLL